MKQAKKHTRFVIFVRPVHADEPLQYIKPDGATTSIGSLAVRFSTRDEAQLFAYEKECDLGLHRYIGMEGFTEFELKAKPTAPAMKAA